jgi:hypothetical protein
MATHSIILSTYDLAEITGLIQERISDLKSGGVSYGSERDNKAQLETLEELNKRLSAPVNADWLPKGKS